jgi:hypothetical protein
LDSAGLGFGIHVLCLLLLSVVKFCLGIQPGIDGIDEPVLNRLGNMDRVLQASNTLCVLRINLLQRLDGFLNLALGALHNVAANVRLQESLGLEAKVDLLQQLILSRVIAHSLRH